MGSRYEEIDLSGVKLNSIHDRFSIVSIDDFPHPVVLKKEQADALLDSIPTILAGNEIRSLADSLKRAREDETPRIWTMGAHPIKVGLSRHIITLLKAGFITHLATNGAGIIHDTEIACFGRTSEDVSGTINKGEFAVTRETGEIINPAISRAHAQNLGLGEALGEDLVNLEPVNLDACIAAQCWIEEIPFTVHVAIGTDVTHIHPNVDPAALGAATHRDFRIFAASVSRLQGGVIVNLGSAVVLPVIIEKAIALTQNLGHKLQDFDGYNLDFIRHYRANLNPVQRALESGGHGANITGHHELTIPFLAALLLAD
jgi:hypothetical protein